MLVELSELSVFASPRVLYRPHRHGQIAIGRIAIGELGSNREASTQGVDVTDRRLPADSGNQTHHHMHSKNSQQYAHGDQDDHSSAGVAILSGSVK